MVNLNEAGNDWTDAPNSHIWFNAHIVLHLI